MKAPEPGPLLQVQKVAAPETVLQDAQPAAALLAQTGRIEALLPQTQCTRCGYPDCHGYAQALAQGTADINQCPPGGAEGVARLSAATGRPVIAINPVNGVEGPRLLAVIDEAWCIGCTLCIKACPVDCIVGASKTMHTVIDALCTGCELCVPACPVDCISLVPVGPATGWAAWSPAQAEQAQERYQFRAQRLVDAARENDERLAEKARQKLQDLAAHSSLSDPAALERKRAIVEASLARARSRK